MIIFTWDENKRLINIKKHQLDFTEAKEAFYDDCSLYYPDPDHSNAEDRYILIGMNKKGDILVVVHCYKDGDSVIRIISARKATYKEKLIYLEGRFI